MDAPASLVTLPASGTGERVHITAFGASGSRARAKGARSARADRILRDLRRRPADAGRAGPRPRIGAQHRHVRVRGGDHPVGVAGQHSRAPAGRPVGAAHAALCLPRYLHRRHRDDSPGDGSAWCSWRSRWWRGCSSPRSPRSRASSSPRSSVRTGAVPGSPSWAWSPARVSAPSGPAHAPGSAHGARLEAVLPVRAHPAGHRRVPAPQPARDAGLRGGARRAPPAGVVLAACRQRSTAAR